jgi:glycosyltransferase involved in cell wall biosynthesis
VIQGSVDDKVLLQRRVVVVIPTYNEVGNIAQVIAGVIEVLPDASILVVDDNSPDGTADLVDKIATELPANFPGFVKVRRRQNKAGLGAAYRDGFAVALELGATICVQMDADLSHHPMYLPAIVSVVDMGADASIGSRYIPGGRIENWPPLRHFLSRWGNRFAAGMLGLAINDATGGYRAYSRSILERMDFSTVQAEGYGFQVEMTHRAVRCGGRIVEVPILFTDRVVGESKLTHHIIGEAFSLVVKLWFKDRILRRIKRR